jgi:hypothetical protein
MYAEGDGVPEDDMEPEPISSVLLVLSCGYDEGRGRMRA